MREGGRRAAKQFLGRLRSFASEVAHIDTELDEEEFFDSIMRQYLRGFVLETYNIFGPKVVDILNPFNGKATRS
jgi:hypothetical protein